MIYNKAMPCFPPHLRGKQSTLLEFAFDFLFTASNKHKMFPVEMIKSLVTYSSSRPAVYGTEIGTLDIYEMSGKETNRKQVLNVAISKNWQKAIFFSKCCAIFIDLSPSLVNHLSAYEFDRFIPAVPSAPSLDDDDIVLSWNDLDNQFSVVRKGPSVEELNSSTSSLHELWFGSDKEMTSLDAPSMHELLAIGCIEPSQVMDMNGGSIYPTPDEPEDIPNPCKGMCARFEGLTI